jgi:hypothetical protein
VLRHGAIGKVMTCGGGYLEIRLQLQHAEFRILYIIKSRALSSDPGSAIQTHGGIPTGLAMAWHHLSDPGSAIQLALHGESKTCTRHHTKQVQCDVQGMPVRQCNSTHRSLQACKEGDEEAVVGVRGKFGSQVEHPHT